MVEALHHQKTFVMAQALHHQKTFEGYNATVVMAQAFHHQKTFEGYDVTVVSSSDIEGLGNISAPVLLVDDFFGPHLLWYGLEILLSEISQTRTLLLAFGVSYACCFVISRRQ
jgi:hypothetical protein